MATLVSKDTSGIYLLREGEVEVGRTRSFKRFATGVERQLRVAGQVGPIHYRLDPFDDAEEWKEIDLDLIPSTDPGWDWMDETNGFQVWFRSAKPLAFRTLRFLAKYQRAGGWMVMRPMALIYENSAGDRQVISLPQAVTTPVIDNEAGIITWPDAFGTNIDFGYRRIPDRFEKFVTIQAASALPRPRINTTGLLLVILMAMAWIPGFSASNGFAAGIDTDANSDFDYTDLDTVDERLDNPGRFPFRDSLSRGCWWMQEPAGRDLNDVRIPMTWSLRRREARVIARFSAVYTTLTEATFPVTLDTVMTEEQVANGADDAYNSGTGTPPPYNSYYGGNTTLLCGRTSFYTYLPGARFTPPLPQGAMIDSASISVRSSSNQGAVMWVRWFAEDVDSAAQFAASTHEPEDSWNSRTTAYVDWNRDAASPWTSGTWYATFDLSSIVQEIVDRAGWAESNGMIFIAQNIYSGAGPYNRSVYAYEYTGNASGAKFNCTYTSAAAFVPQIRWW